MIRETKDGVNVKILYKYYFYLWHSRQIRESKVLFFVFAVVGGTFCNFSCKAFWGVKKQKKCFKRSVKRQNLCFKRGVIWQKLCTVYHGALICQKYYIPRCKSVKVSLSFLWKGKIFAGIKNIFVVIFLRS